MKFVNDAISAIKSVPKPVWIALVVPGGFIYLGVLVIKIIYNKTREHSQKDL